MGDDFIDITDDELPSNILIRRIAFCNISDVFWRIMPTTIIEMFDKHILLLYKYLLMSLLIRPIIDVNHTRLRRRKKLYLPIL